MAVTALLFAGTNLPSDLVRWGEGGAVGEITHVAYDLADGWTLSAGATGLGAYPSEHVGGATIRWPLLFTADETRAWVAALRATVGRPYGWLAIGEDLMGRVDVRLAGRLAATTPPGLVCSSQGAATLAATCPRRYAALFGSLAPALVEPKHWHAAYLATLPAAKVVGA